MKSSIHPRNQPKISPDQQPLISARFGEGRRERPPHAFPRKILLAVTGLSPQILTETLYALAVAQDPPFIPNEVHIITTGDGARNAKNALLDSGLGRFTELLRDYGLEGQIRFDADCIHEIEDCLGKSVPDIQTPEETELAADAITELVRRFTQDDNSALHVSIAGGRKSMGFFMGYALSLYGRTQDRMSHVLVSSPFESNHEFYFPPIKPCILFDRNDQPINTREARIMLANIPFVRLRHGLADSLLEGRTSFNQAVHEAQSSLGAPELVIDVKGHTLNCSGVAIAMEPVHIAYYYWLAKRLKQGLGPIRYDNPGAVAEFLDAYAEVLQDPHSGYLDKASSALERRQNEVASKRKTAIRKYFDPLKSRVNRELETRLGNKRADAFLVKSSGQRLGTVYGLGGLQENQVTFI